MSPSSGRTKSASLPCRPLKRALPFRGQSLVPWRVPRPPLFPPPRRCLLGTCNVPGSARGAGDTAVDRAGPVPTPGSLYQPDEAGGLRDPRGGALPEGTLWRADLGESGSPPGRGGVGAGGEGLVPGAGSRAAKAQGRAAGDRGTRPETRPELPKEHEGAARGTLRSPECSGLHAMGTEKGLKTAPAAPASRPQPPLPAPIPRAHPGTQTLRLPWPDRSFQSASRWNPGPGLLCLALG